MSTIVTLEDRINGLLKRREVKCLFRGLAGKLTRKEAVEMLAKELKLDKKFIIPVRLMCETGMKDVSCTFYVYDDDSLTKKHLPKYVFMRMLTKEERKKAREAEKAKGKKPAEVPPAETKKAKEETKAEEKVEEAKKEAPKEETVTEAKEKAESKAARPEGEAKV